MAFPNVHRDLDNSELHVPLDFNTALPNTNLRKNAASELEWSSNNGGVCWDCPVLDVVDGNLPPPTSAAGDRYIVVSIGNTLDTAWGSIDFNDIVQRVDVSGTLDWVGLTPIHGSTVFDESRDGYWYFDGTNWQGNDFNFAVNIASTAVLTLNSSPVTLAEAPLSIFGGQMSNVSVQLDYNTTPYATNTQLQFKAATGSVAQVIDAATLTQSTDYWNSGNLQAGNNIVAGDALQLTVNGGDPTAGDSPIKVTGKYRLIRTI